ncbi:heme utilization protein HutZ [Thiomicrorhabdus hydrogeniphila]
MTHQQMCQTFFKSRKTLILSTQDREGVIETSVAPFVFIDGVFYIYISELAKHTQNLMQQLQSFEANPTLDDDFVQISGLLLADENQTEQLFARERITLQLTVAKVSKESEKYQTIISLLSKEFGEVVTMLKSLPDFHMFALTTIKGGYVRGFGQAFAFNDYPCQELAPITKN